MKGACVCVFVLCGSRFCDGVGASQSSVSRLSSLLSHNNYKWSVPSPESYQYYCTVKNVVYHVTLP